MNKPKQVYSLEYSLSTNGGTVTLPPDDGYCGTGSTRFCDR